MRRAGWPRLLIIQTSASTADTCIAVRPCHAHEKIVVSTTMKPIHISWATMTNPRLSFRTSVINEAVTAAQPSSPSSTQRRLGMTIR